MKYLIGLGIIMASSYSMACEYPAVMLPESMSCVAIECKKGDCSPSLDSYDVRFIDLSNAEKARLRYETTATETKVVTIQNCDSQNLMLATTGLAEVDNFTAKKSDIKKLVSGRVSSIELGRSMGLRTDTGSQTVRFVSMECLITD